MVRESLKLVKSEKCPKIVQNGQKKGGTFDQKLKISIQYMILSFFHFTIKFNSNYQLSISIFSGIFNSKDYSITFFFLKVQFKNLNLAVFNSTKYSFIQKTKVSPTPSQKTHFSTKSMINCPAAKYKPYQTIQKRDIGQWRWKLSGKGQIKNNSLFFSTLELTVNMFTLGHQGDGKQNVLLIFIKGPDRD